MMHFLQTIHLVFGTFLIGACFAMTVLIYRQIKTQQWTRLVALLQFALICDAVFLLLIAMQFVTGTRLVFDHHYPFSTPWIIVAYTLLSVVTLNIICCCGIKWYNYIQLRSNTVMHFRFYRLFLSLNACIVILLILMIRDAVLRSTMF